MSTLSVIVPVYNEQQTITAVLDQISVSFSIAQVIVVDDGSDDRTSQLLDAWKQCNDVIVLKHYKNQGKGAAIRTALPHAIGTFVIIQDADLEYCPNDYNKVLKPLKTGRCQVVYGSRYLPASIACGKRGAIPYLGVQLLNLAAKIVYGCQLTDLATCYKAFPTELLRQMELNCRGFEFCAEVTAKSCRMGLSIQEVPIQYSARSLKEGKKIRWWHGLSMLATLWKYRNWNPPAVNPAKAS